MDRRTSLRWMLTAAASLPFGSFGFTSAAFASNTAIAKPYGPDPKLTDPYHPGELWPLTFSTEQRRLATMLCDTIIPADSNSPNASAVGVVDFVDEWISAPYARQRADCKTVLEGFAWLDVESKRRYRKLAVDLDE